MREKEAGYFTRCARLFKIRLGIEQLAINTPLTQEKNSVHEKHEKTMTSYLGKVNMEMPTFYHDFIAEMFEHPSKAPHPHD